MGLFPDALVAEHFVDSLLVSVVVLDVSHGDERLVSEQLVKHAVLEVQGHDLANGIDILLLHNCRVLLGLFDEFLTVDDIQALGGIVDDASLDVVDDVGGRGGHECGDDEVAAVGCHFVGVLCFERTQADECQQDGRQSFRAVDGKELHEVLVRW